MNVGIFGGSFDPVHNGHVKLASHMLSELSLDSLLIVPAYRCPFKPEDASHAADRVEMCRLAFSDPRTEICTLETERGGRSYTVDTVSAIKKQYGEDNGYFLIVGADQLMKFSRWYRFADILSSVTLCAAARTGTDKRAELERCADNELRRYGQCLISDFEPLEISSTLIRETLASGSDASAYLPGAVYDYIKDRGLYR